MARAPAGAAAAQGGAPARPRRSWFWLQGLACGVLVATAAPLALVLSVLMAPSLIAALAQVPQGAAPMLLRIMLVYAAAALLPWVPMLWSAAQDWPASLSLLGELRLPAIAWGAQGAAWLFSQLAPVGVRLVLEARVRARKARLIDARARLQEEWGLPTE